MSVYIYIKTQNRDDAIMPKPAPAGRTPQVATNLASSTYDLPATRCGAKSRRIALTFLPDKQAEPARLTYRQFSVQLHQAANAFHRLWRSSGQRCLPAGTQHSRTFVALWLQNRGHCQSNQLPAPAEDIARCSGQPDELLIALGHIPSWTSGKSPGHRAQVTIRSKPC